MNIYIERNEEKHPLTAQKIKSCGVIFFIARVLMKSIVLCLRIIKQNCMWVMMSLTYSYMINLAEII